MGSYTVLGNRKPNEILLKRLPTYEHLRVFGCLAYAYNTLGEHDKFDERGRPCFFLGYPIGQQGYKLYNLKDQRIHITRNVTFVESKFPFGEKYKGHKTIVNKQLVDALIEVQDDVDMHMDLLNGTTETDHEYSPLFPMHPSPHLQTTTNHKDTLNLLTTTRILTFKPVMKRGLDMEHRYT